MNTHRIAIVSVLPANMLNSFILIGERPILVDSGMPGSAPKILAALARDGFAPSDVSLILITHRHVDHIGSAAELQRATRAPVAVHALDADWLRRGDDPIIVRRSLLQLLNRGAERFFVGHGGPLSAKGVRSYIAREPRLQPDRRAA